MSQDVDDKNCQDFPKARNDFIVNLHNIFCVDVHDFFWFNAFWFDGKNCESFEVVFVSRKKASESFQNKNKSTHAKFSKIFETASFVNSQKDTSK